MTTIFITIMVAFIVFCLAEAHRLSVANKSIQVDPHIWDDLDEPIEEG